MKNQSIYNLRCIRNSDLENLVIFKDNKQIHLHSPDGAGVKAKEIIVQRIKTVAIKKHLILDQGKSYKVQKMLITKKFLLNYQIKM